MEAMLDSREDSLVIDEDTSSRITRQSAGDSMQENYHKKEVLDLEDEIDKFRRESQQWEQLRNTYRTEKVMSKSQQASLEKGVDNSSFLLHGSRSSNLLALPSWNLDCQKVLAEAKNSVDEAHQAVLAIREHKSKLQAFQPPNDKANGKSGAACISIRSSLPDVTNLSMRRRSTRSLVRTVTQHEPTE